MPSLFRLNTTVVPVISKLEVMICRCTAKVLYSLAVILLNELAHLSPRITLLLWTF